MAVAAMCCFPKLHWPLRFLHFQTQSLLRRMTLKENLFQAQTENQTQLQNYYPFYQHKIYSFTQYLLQGVKGLAYVIRIIPRIILILKIVFASIISWLKMYKERAIDTGKAKDVTGNDRKVILCTKWFGNYIKL